MDEACRADRSTYAKDQGIIVPDDIKNEILLLSNTTLSVHEIINATEDKHGCFTSNDIPISKSFRYSIISKIKEFDIAFDLCPDLQYWRLFFKYAPQLINMGYFYEAMKFFPRIDETFIAAQGRSTSVVCDTLKYDFEIKLPLYQYADDLEKIEQIPFKKLNQKEKIGLFDTMSLKELNSWNTIFLANVAKSIAKFRLRPTDLRTIQRILLMYSYDEIEFFFEDAIYPRLIGEG